MRIAVTSPAAVTTSMTKALFLFISDFAAADC
jgi:hypothetical protein